MRRFIETHSQPPHTDLFAVTVHPGTRVAARPETHFFRAHVPANAVNVEFSSSGPEDIFNLVLAEDVALDLIRVVLAAGILPERLMAEISDLAKPRAT